LGLPFVLTQMFCPRIHEKYLQISIRDCGSQLVWYDASGKQGEPVLPGTADYSWPSLSPDVSKLAFALENNGVADIWVVDVARHTKTRLTFGPQYSSRPIWWPDGKSIVFSYGPSGSALDSLYRQNADGTGGKEKLLETPGIVDNPFSVSPDGRYIAYVKGPTSANTPRCTPAMAAGGGLFDNGCLTAKSRVVRVCKRAGFRFVGTKF
jgi:Tol biopolymer transport system component